MTNPGLETLPLPKAGDEGWRGTALRTLEGLSLASETLAVEPVRLAPLLEAALRGNTDGTVFVDGSTGMWLRRDGGGWDNAVSVGENALGLALSPKWVGWTEGFLWSARLQEKTAVPALAVVADGKVRRLVLLSTGGGTTAVHIQVAPGATLEIVELRENGMPEVLAATRTVMSLGAGSQVHWYRAIAGEGARADDVEVTAADGARLEWSNVTAAGRLSRTDARVFLRGKSASFRLNGLAITEGKNVADFRIGIEHGAPVTKSQQEYRTLANHQSASLFHGRVVIPPKCPGVEAHQQAPSLLLDRGARVQSRPQLEIHTDEVQCSHGSTVGELDANALFYLRSRGIDPETARKLLVEGFARAVIEPWAAVVPVEALDLLWQGGVA